jgi:hypothetical protein
MPEVIHFEAFALKTRQTYQFYDNPMHGRPIKGFHLFCARWLFTVYIPNGLMLVAGVKGYASVAMPLPCDYMQGFTPEGTQVQWVSLAQLTLPHSFSSSTGIQFR